jgi:hypothetical protein
VSTKQFLVVFNWQELAAKVEVAQTWSLAQSASEEQLREEIEQLGAGLLLSVKLLLNFQWEIIWPKISTVLGAGS